MATLTHAQYNSPLPLYSRENVQEVLNQVTQYPRSHSSMSGSSFDPSQSQVYRYLQTSGQLPAAHSARYDEYASEYPRYRGFVDPNVQSPSFKRLQYVTGVDSGAEDEATQEAHPPPETHTEDIRSTRHVQQQSQQGDGQAQQPIALGYAPVGGDQQRQYQQNYQQYQQQQQYQYPQQYYQQQQGTVQTQWSDQGPLVAQRDPAAPETDRDHLLDPRFAQRIAEAERPKVPPPVVPSWARFAERKYERWHQQTGRDDSQQRASTPPPAATSTAAQYYRPPPPPTQYQPQWTLDSTRTAQDKWQAHYAPYRFEGAVASARTERPRSRSLEPNYTGTRPKYGGGKEWLKPFIAPNLRWQYGEGPPPPRPTFSPINLGKTYTTTTTQDYNQYQSGAGAAAPNFGTQTQTYADLSSNQSHRFGTGHPSQHQGGTGTFTSAYDSTISTSGRGQDFGAGSAIANGHVGSGAPTWTKDSQYSRTAHETRKEGGYQVAPIGGVQSQSLWQSEQEARRQRQLMEQEVTKRAASSGPSPGRQVDSTVTTSNQSWRNRPVPSETAVTAYSTTGTGPKWQQAPGSETKTQSSGSYLDPEGNKVTFTKEVYTSSDPGKEFSMLTEQEKKILEEPLQPGVISRHITTKYYKKSTYTSSTTTSSSQTPPVTTSSRQAIQGGPSGKQF